MFPLLSAEPWLGTAPSTPAAASLPLISKSFDQTVASGFSVDTSSREQVRSFYNAVYLASEGVPMGSTADTANCVPGTNSPAFEDAVLCRINWFRAMAGVPATVAFDPLESIYDQEAALMMSANNTVQHTDIPSSWSCFTSDGTNAAAHSNLALGVNGPEAITDYMWDFGANNFNVGHRRWILYPQTEVMATGDVPQQGANLPANATWVFDSNLYGPRPATRTNFVAWPPAGYVPYQVVFPRWSFGLSNAVLNYATVSMTSNGVNMTVTTEPYATGYGENTLVWHPANLNPTNASTVFPFNGTDTVYTVTISGIRVGIQLQTNKYSVTVFDPAVALSPSIVLSTPVVSGGQVQLNFTVTDGPATSFHLLQTDALGQTWTTNAAAELTTNVPSGSYCFTTTNGTAIRFYRIQSP